MITIFVLVIIIIALNGHFHFFNIDNKKWLKYVIIAFLVYIGIVAIYVLINLGTIANTIRVFYNMYLNPAVPHY